jgi:hypothetical protein
MSYSDAEIRAAAVGDQREATAKDVARDIAGFYTELIAQGAPKDLAKSLTKAFAVTVMFNGCGCAIDA